jgi:hypothetical protein
MEDMYNMKDSMQMHSYCSRVSCPMMVMQSSLPSCMNYNMNNNMYGAVSMSCQHMPMYGARPMRSSIANIYFFQTEMRPVPINEIED